jgi:hypothetical protein
MKTVLITLVGVSAAIFSTGCVVRIERPEPVAEVSVETPDVEVSGPVVEGPGVEVISVEPDPVERVYVYDPGYPPGTYFYGGFYWYGGYRYPRDVFYNRYVAVNIREHRFADAEANRRRGAEIERTHREEFAKTGGRHPEAARQSAAQHQAAARQQSSRAPGSERTAEITGQHPGAQQQHQGLQPPAKKQGKKDEKE